MDKLPFNLYDFFAHLAPGFITFAAIDFAFDIGWLTSKEIVIPLAIFWIVAGYVVGHIVASLSGFFIENLIVRKLLHSPEEALFLDNEAKGWPLRVRRLAFSGFYRPLTDTARRRVLVKAEAKVGASVAGRDLFLHCHPIMKRDEKVGKRLDTFLNLYGFCRNVCMACALAIPILLAGAFDEWRVYSKISPSRLWWAVGAAVCALGMFYRYLKFFRLYTHEVFINYAEID